MRRQTTIIRCDGNGCKEVAEVESLGFTPEGWYRIQVADTNDKIQPNQGFDLHSLRCVEKWAHERRMALEGSSHNRNSNNQILSDIKTAIKELNGQDFSVQEIADLTGSNKTTVIRRLHELEENGAIFRVKERSGPNGTRFAESINSKY